MGRLEKIVVLTVLFLVAVVLGVALNPSDSVADPEPGPLLASTETPAIASGPPAERPPIRRDEQRAGAAPRGLLNAGVGLNPGPESEQPPVATPGERRVLGSSGDNSGSADAEPAPATPQERRFLNDPAPRQPNSADELRPNPAERRRADESVRPAQAAVRGQLLTLDGLDDSRVPDMMLYAWQRGDTFDALARRYYGSQSKTHVLTYANEGRKENNLRAGEQIWVPVYDRSQSDGDDTGTIYVVESGDYLGAISKKIYGSARDWKRIYDANRDVLDDPDSVRPGMRLRIPE